MVIPPSCWTQRGIPYPPFFDGGILMPTPTGQIAPRKCLLWATDMEPGDGRYLCVRPKVHATQYVHVAVFLALHGVVPKVGQ